MRRWFFHWVRLTLPSPTWVVLFFLAVLSVETLRYLINWLEGRPLFAAPLSDLSRVRCGIAMFTAVSYGLFRVARFHPLYSSEYRQWLELTPWTVRHPLPCGPARLVAQDGIVMAVLAACALDTRGGGPAMPLLVTGAYLAALAPSFFVLNRRQLGYVILAGLILSVRMAGTPAIALGILFVTYLFAAIGLQRTLSEFPWTNLPQFFETTNWAEQMADQQKGKGVAGWPWDLLNPRREFFSTPFSDALWIAVLSGGAVHTVDIIVEQFFQPRQRFPVGAALAAYLMFGGLIARLALYVTSFAPPINIWGRLGTFRWIVPSYDVVVIGPLLAVLSYGAGMSTIGWLGVHAGMVIAPIGVGLAVFFLLHTGPTVRRWELLGKHRIAARGLNKQKFFEL